MKELASFIIYAVLGGAFIYLLSASWFKWGDLIIDTPRELWIPLKMMRGGVLYRDIFYSYGLLPPYLLSCLYRIFGVSINCLVGCGIAVTILMTAAIYKISRLFLDDSWSGLTALTFLFVFAFGAYFGNGNFNFILPYSFAATFSVLFTALALYFFLRFISGSEEKHILLWAFFLSLSFLSRPEISALTWVGFALVGAVFVIKAKPPRAWRTLVYLIFPIVLSAAVYLLFLSKNGAFAGFGDSINNYIKVGVASGLTAKIAGLDHPWENLFYAFVSLAAHIAAIITISIMTNFILLPLFRRTKSLLLSLLPGGILTFMLFMLIKNYFASDVQYMCILPILAIGILSCGIELVRGVDFRKNLSLLTLSLTALILALRIFLNAIPHWYGFCLLGLSLICYYIFYFKISRYIINRYLRQDFNMFSMLLFIFFALSVVPHWQYSLGMYDLKSLKIISDRGKIFYYNNRQSLFFCQAVNYLIRCTPEDSTLAVFPEGVSVNFFAKRDNPTRYCTFLPVDIAAIGEEKIISDLERADIDYIVILQRDTREYGFGNFGVGYAKKLFSWINKRYEILKQFGPLPYTSNVFGVVILKNRNLNTPTS